MKKAPPMPKLPNKDGIERHSAYTRLNPNGDEEFVVDDDEETLNELAESLQECAEEYIWNHVRDNLPKSIFNKPGVKKKIDDAIGRGAAPDEIIAMFESISFGGPLATGGGAGSPEQPESDRRHNSLTPELVGSSGDQVRVTGDDVNNFTSTTRQAADGPENSRAKSKIRTRTIRGNGPRNKYIAGSSVDGITYGVTHSESFTGTGAIAISPGGGYSFVDDDDDEEDDQDPEKQTESDMTRQNDVLIDDVDKLLTEWEPSFSGGEYSPGEYPMPSPTGDGVADRKPTKDKVGSYDTDTSNAGKEWPRDFKDSAAMSSVDDQVLDDAGGSHESSSGDAKDGHQSEVGHNWPDEAKNSGSGVAEPFEGDRWSDGGTLQGGSGQDELDNAGTDQKLPNSGPITGTSGPQMGQPSEDWTPKNIGSLIGEDHDLQALFDSYARQYDMVCTEDFQALCNAHGVGVTLNDNSIIGLMAENKEFIFYHGEDANGPYWAATPITEMTGTAGADAGSGKPWENNDDDDGSDDDDDDCDMVENTYADRQRMMNKIRGTSHKSPRGDSSQTADIEKRPPIDDEEDDSNAVAEGENRRPFGQMLSEVQIRSRSREVGQGAGGGVDYFDGEHRDRPDTAPGSRAAMGPGMNHLDYTSQLDPEMGAEMGPDPMGPEMGMDDPMAGGDNCPECGAIDTGEAACPECGAEMGMAPEEDAFGPGPGGDISRVGSPDDVDFDDEFDQPGPPQLTPSVQQRPMNYESRTNSPKIMDSLNKFMTSARSILENNKEFSPYNIGEALRYSWAFHAGSVNPRTTPTNIQETIKGLAKQFPVFGSIMEGGSDAMDSSDGTAIGTGGASNSSGHLPDQPGPDEMKDEGDALGKSQTNNLDGTPEIKGTAKGMDGKGSVAQTVKENVARLSRYVQKAIKECVGSLRGKYNVAFALVVNEGKTKNRTASKQHLAESLADAEEILQLHDSKDVELEATFTDSTGAVVLKHNIPLLTIKPRGLLATEGTAIFRFHRTAERFAGALVAEGVACRVIGHNWGHAVKAKTTSAIAEGAFRKLHPRRKPRRK